MPSFITRRSLINRMLGTAALACGMLLPVAGFAQEAEPAPAAEPVAAVINGPQYSIKTTMGEIVVHLDQDKAPKTVANFAAYAKSGFYKDTIFHRVIDGFMIQAGGMNEKFEGKKTLKPVQNESNNGLSNMPYTIAMARENNPDSATSQWFINVANNSGIDHPFVKGSGYTVFGKVVKGQDVVDKIKGMVVDDVRGMQNVPVVPIKITSVTLLKGDKLVK